jgi:hypothetical protein
MSAENGTFVRINPPRYVAFQEANGSSTLPVIARLEARNRAGRHLGCWFTELAPYGEFRDVPVDADGYSIDESIALDLIHRIRNGEPLPSHIVELLPKIPNATETGTIRLTPRLSSAKRRR